MMQEYQILTILKREKLNKLLLNLYKVENGQVENVENNNNAKVIIDTL